MLAVRGRVGDVQPTALVDLGRPTFKLGIAEITVGWQAHELKVRVAAEHDVYRVRDKAQVKIAVRTADGTPARPPAARSRSPPSTKACSSSRPTRAGSCSTP